MVSAVDRAKRALVALLRYLATAYGCVVDVTRDSDDAAVRRAYRLVSRRVHPDRGGNEEDQKKLNGAHDEWCQAQRDKGPRGRPAPGADRPEPRNDPQATAPSGLAAQAGGPLPRAAFRIEGQAVLLTYQGITGGVLQWERFVAFARSHLKPWRGQYWTATLETNKDGTHHAHLMLQFFAKKDCSVNVFAFEGLRPNAQANDLLGGGWNKNRWQERALT